MFAESNYQNKHWYLLRRKLELTQLRCLPSELLVAIPLGIYADRWGRKSVLYCNILSGLLYYGWVVVVCMHMVQFRCTRVPE
jgi:hypothetical protein